MAESPLDQGYAGLVEGLTRPARGLNETVDQFLKRQFGDMREAAEALSQAYQRIEGLEDKLRPFAHAYETFGSECVTYGEWEAMRNMVDINHFRNAHALLSLNEPDAGQGGSFAIPAEVGATDLGQPTASEATADAELIGELRARTVSVYDREDGRGGAFYRDEPDTLCLRAAGALAASGALRTAAEYGLDCFSALATDAYNDTLPARVLRSRLGVIAEQARDVLGRALSSEVLPIGLSENDMASQSQSGGDECSRGSLASGNRSTSVEGE